MRKQNKGLTSLRAILLVFEECGVLESELKEDVESAFVKMFRAKDDQSRKAAVNQLSRVFLRDQRRKRRHDPS